MISEDTRRVIDSLSRDELINEINRHNRSRFQGDNYAYLQTRLALIDEQQRVESQEQQILIAKEANCIAREANDIAKDAATTAGRAYRMSGFAVVVALLAIIISMVSQCTKA